MITNYLILIFLICFLFSFNSKNLFAQDKFKFNLSRAEKDFRFESCIPNNKYNPRLIIPRTYVTKKEPVEDILMMASVGRWDNDCLIDDLDQSINEEETIDFNMVFTVLTKDQIIIK